MSDAAPSDDDLSKREEPSLPVSAEPEAPPRKPHPVPMLRVEAPFRDAPEYEARPAAATKGRDWKRIRAAASLAALVVIGGAAAAAHVHALNVATAGQAQARGMAQRLDTISSRLETLEANRSRDEVASLRKLLAEIKSSAANTRDVGGVVGQLVARVDKIEKEQGARLDKLGERIDHDSAARLTEMTARLDKLEAKVAAPAKPAAPVVATAPAKPATATEVAKAAPGVSYDPTGAIDKPRPRLRGYFLAQVHNGYATIDSPGGEFAVAPGDLVPGGGRVLRIERRGRDWVVVTTQGQIVAEDD